MSIVEPEESSSTGLKITYFSVICKTYGCIHDLCATHFNIAPLARVSLYQLMTDTIQSSFVYHTFPTLVCFKHCGASSLPGLALSHASSVCPLHISRHTQLTAQLDTHLIIYGISLTETFSIFQGYPPFAES